MPTKQISYQIIETGEFLHIKFRMHDLSYTDYYSYHNKERMNNLCVGYRLFNNYAHGLRLWARFNKLWFESDLELKSIYELRINYEI